jgi:hypothetical protein
MSRIPTPHSRGLTCCIAAALAKDRSAYTSLRAVLAEHSTFDPKVGAALTLATAAGAGNGYMIRIASRLAKMNGWVEEHVTALRTGNPTGDVKIDALTGLVREAAANSGNVTDATWKAAQKVRCTSLCPLWANSGHGATQSADLMGLTRKDRTKLLRLHALDGLSEFTAVASEYSASQANPAPVEQRISPWPQYHYAVIAGHASSC